MAEQGVQLQQTTKPFKTMTVEVTITILFSMGFGALVTWVLMKGKSKSVNPPKGGGGSTSDSDRLNKQEK